jgi:murein DD-endopeptidase MepM/ murein hydrolase activator NlpD
MTDRPFKVPTSGEDVRDWQEFLTDRFRRAWNINYELEQDGVYGAATRSATASFMRAWGVESAKDELNDGLTSFWRSKLRANRRTPEEEACAYSSERTDYRSRLRQRFERMEVCYPVPNLVTDDWDWHPGVHDGIDLVCPWKQPLLAICTGKIVRVNDDHWWGNNPKPSPGHPISDGDGIVILECTISAGPFKPGLHFGYGHAEGATVKVGDQVKAGQVIAHAGFAVQAHTHFMVNDNPPVNGLYRGVGDRDPKPFLNYAGNND